MKVCLASIHPRRLSGQIESLVALSRELARMGHETRVVTAFDDLHLGRRDVALARREAGATAGGKIACMLKATARLARAGRQADLIHFSLPTPAFSWLADLLRIGFRDGPPIVVGYESHLSDVWQLLRGDYFRRAPRFYLPLALVNNGLWGRLAFYRCERYVVASRWQRGELRALGVEERRLVSLPNLINWEKLRRVAKEEARRALLGCGLAGPLIGWSGHFHDVKGVDTLLQAVDRLRVDWPDLRLLLAWSGIGGPRPVEARIRSLGLDEHVLRLGQVDMGLFLSTLDALALPYRLSIGQGAFPNLVMEAMAVGVPLVTSDLPLLRELLEHGRTALLTRPDDAAGLAVELGRVLSEPALAASMVADQRALMAGKLAPASLAARYVALYERVLAEHQHLGQPCRRPRLVRSKPAGLPGVRDSVNAPPGR